MSDDIGLVFVHGAGEDGRVWERQLATFGGSRKALAVDLPGRAGRRHEAPFTSHDDNARDVLAKMDEAGIRRAVVVGHSMGGAVALTIALRHPDRLAGLVLVVTGARLRMNPEFLEKAKQQASSAQAEPPVPLERTVAASVKPEVLEWIRPRAMSAPPKTIYADFQANNVFDVMERLGEVSTPTLVVAADEDRMAPPKFSQFMADKIPGARMVTLVGSGHYPQVEQQERFDTELAQFIAGLEKR
jgi:pimeloyl-ACP methyl ester carboxylesterase